MNLMPFYRLPPLIYRLSPLSLVMLALCVLLFGPTDARAQDSSTTPDTSASQSDESYPDAASIFEDYIKATGGIEAYKAHTNRILYGVLTNVKTGDESPLTLYLESPNKLYALIELPAIGNTIRASDGKTAWGINIDGQPFKMNGADAKDFLDAADFFGEADYKNRYSSIKTIGIADIDGKPAYHVEFTTKTGLKGYVFFDKATKLLVARMIIHDDPDNPDTLALVKNYQEHDGLMIPMLQQQRKNNQTTSILEFRWVKTDVDPEMLPDFSPPQALAVEPTENPSSGQ